MLPGGLRRGAPPPVLGAAHGEQVELLGALRRPGEDEEALPRVPAEEEVDAGQRLPAPLHLHHRHRGVEDGPAGVVVEEPLAVRGEEEVDPLAPGLVGAGQRGPAPALVDHRHADRRARHRSERRRSPPADPLAPGEGKPGLRRGSAFPATRSRSPGQEAASPIGRSASAMVRAAARSCVLALRVEGSPEEQVAAGHEDGVGVLLADAGHGGGGARQAPRAGRRCSRTARATRPGRRRRPPSRGAGARRRRGRAARRPRVSSGPPWL